MPAITALPINPVSLTGKTVADYYAYLLDYRAFTVGKRIFAPGSTAKVDSQFSERLAADYFCFNVNHTTNLDGVDPVTGDTYEVKGTGFANNKAHFNAANKADHVIWIKIKRNCIELREIDVDIYNHLDARGFVNINKHMIQLSIATFAY